jgi:N-acetylglucosamine kinase-like BadF-type ATPase
MELVLDLGQSGARVRYAGADYSFNLSKNSSEPVIGTLQRIFEQIPKQEFESIFLSLTGLQGVVPDTTPYGNLCREFFKAKSVAVIDDGLAAYCGAIGLENGVVLTLGGGVVAIAGRNGLFAHSDGKGPIFGDYGGGFWIGQMGLSRAIATLDGRDDAKDLVELLENELKIYRSLENSTGTEAAALCISTAKSVLDGASNDVVSAQVIAEEAADKLSITVMSAWQKTQPATNEVPLISFLGGLSQSSYFTNLLSKNIATRISTAKFINPAGNHLDGAPVVAKAFPAGLKPLLDWWRA